MNIALPVAVLAPGTIQRMVGLSWSWAHTIVGSGSREGEVAEHRSGRGEEPLVLLDYL